MTERETWGERQRQRGERLKGRETEIGRERDRERDRDRKNDREREREGGVRCN